MLRDSAEQDKPNKIFTLATILKGDFDADFRSWARAARAFGSVLIVEYGTEVNGRWFPWNGYWNGGGKTNGYGNPKYPDGPERFRDAYRRIITLMRKEGAGNITWVFHLNCNDWPAVSWNRFEKYYPGDSYIDWIGVSVYGAQTPMEEEWPQFRAMMDEVYPRMKALTASKPMALLEFGVTKGNPLGDQAVWAQKALADLIKFRWPRVFGFSWWNEAWENDDNPDHDTTMRLQDNPALAAVFKKQVGGNANVLGRPLYSTVSGPNKLSH
jgi:beta-mannanase